MIRRCCKCDKVEQGGKWRYLQLVPADTRVTHGYCPECFAETLAEIEDFIGAKANGDFGAVGWPAHRRLGSSCV